MERAFLKELSGAAPLPTGEGLGEALAAAAQRARRAWPQVSLSDEALAQVLAHKAQAAPGASWVERLLALHVEGLFLCAACARGDAMALGHFERAYLSGLEALAARFERAGVTADELRQAVRERLFVTPLAGGPPRVAGYSGRGELAGWVRVAATRVGVLLATRGQAEEPVGDLLAGELPLAEQSPELSHLRSLFRDEFRAAFDGALAERTRRQRLLLRQRFVDGLTVAQLSKLHGVHVSTVARWQTEALDALLAALREALMTRLDVKDHELDSLLKLVRSQLDVTLRRLLSTPAR